MNPILVSLRLIPRFTEPRSYSDHKLQTRPQTTQLIRPSQMFSSRQEEVPKRQHSRRILRKYPKRAKAEFPREQSWAQPHGQDSQNHTESLLSCLEKHGNKPQAATARVFPFSQQQTLLMLKLIKGWGTDRKEWLQGARVLHRSC